jgi:hypothetical protein
MGSGLDSLDAAIDMFLSERIGTADYLQGVRQHLSMLSAQLKSGRTQIDGFREVIGSLPTYTVKFRKAKNLTVKLLTDLSASLTIPRQSKFHYSENSFKQCLRRKGQFRRLLSPITSTNRWPKGCSKTAYFHLSETRQSRQT